MASNMINKAKSGYKGAKTLEKPSESSSLEEISNMDDPVIESKKQWKSPIQRNHLPAQGMTLEFTVPTIRIGRQLWSYAKLRWNLKQIYAQNGITSLTISEGMVVTKRYYIESEILDFYKQLLGVSVNSLPVVNPVVIRDGLTLNRAQQLYLVKFVLRQEVRDALQGISNVKAPGYDRFNALLFKQSWHIIGEEITDMTSSRPCSSSSHGTS
ncbi:hypothetical protein FXO38_24145 [Capsicum annuum]|uniref:Uncharacterized protein n=1 Tax=Capsicum annuum TaxID=4072 RepID=A0A2G2YWH4_CAPAN|nr:hypothetical protein FXO38_24145 [Capsicum annuum]KAF3662765.1 hypothetical protein FXO37_12307 [Capsicum annuum]PHT74089.1 hypothetical protein T459_21366 [Capsicum annuum]